MPTSVSSSASSSASPAKARRATPTKSSSSLERDPQTDASGVDLKAYDIGTGGADVKSYHSSLIKSKERVRDLAEVYTAEREVNAMLDLVKDEAKRIDSRFLEPACGNGNFLSAI